MGEPAQQLAKLFVGLIQANLFPKFSGSTVPILLRGCLAIPTVCSAQALLNYAASRCSGQLSGQEGSGDTLSSGQGYELGLLERSEDPAPRSFPGVADQALSSGEAWNYTQQCVRL